MVFSRSSSGNDLALTYMQLSSQLLDSFPDSSLYFANQAEIIFLKNDPDNLLPELV